VEVHGLDRLEGDGVFPHATAAAVFAVDGPHYGAVHLLAPDRLDSVHQIFHRILLYFLVIN
jgi:hypothetical protein